MIEFNGKKYSLSNSGYYKRTTRNAKGMQTYLHRDIYEKAHGKIDDNMHVHHVNGNPTDNRLENLVALTPAEHRDAHYEAFRDYISVKFRYGGNPNAVSVVCLETEEVFDSAQRAADVHNTHKSNICYVCKGKRHTAGGLHWMYFDDWLEYNR